MWNVPRSKGLRSFVVVWQKSRDVRRIENGISPPGQPVILTEEAADLQFWAQFQSWTFCDTCGKLEPTKLLPAFRRKTATSLHNTCKCSNATYVVPSLDDVPFLLRNVTIEDQRLLSPFEIHSGDYVRMFNGYRQRTGPFRVTWCKQMVQQKICLVFFFFF